MATRIYNYGLVPIEYPPREAVDELWRANNAWKMIQFHFETKMAH